jgi:hypothetical protein
MNRFADHRKDESAGEPQYQSYRDEPTEEKSHYSTGTRRVTKTLQSQCKRYWELKKGTDTDKEE